MKGKIIRGVGGFYYVHGTDGEVYECRAKGIFRKENVKPLVGDDVEISVIDVGKRTGNVDLLLARRNALIRPAAANVDQALVVFAATSPRPNLNLLDRFLIRMCKEEIPVAICFNKTDLVGEEQRRDLERVYAGSGCSVYSISVAEEKGLSELRAFLAEKTTILAGPSGVGKSSLTNAFLNRSHMEVGAVSEKVDRGKHTTRHTELLVLPLLDGEAAPAYILDTPGFSSLHLSGFAYEELKGYFSEFDEPAAACRFLTCMHLKEPDCAVKAAVSVGKIHTKRYESYVLLASELAAQKKYEHK